ncbi:MAG: ABC transporter substrate-binding protein, partial [Candidatus Izemoplasmatales bacterium]|nr:ABC transporter substrate-binding protein [Candidatus Izemoplasmatales bacterium]
RSAASLPYTRIPSMAASLPVDVNGDGFTWQITLKQNLQFADGTLIDAYTFDYSWEKLLNPQLQNINASVFLDPDRLGLVNAYEYYYQNFVYTDSLGYEIFTVGSVEYTRANSYYGTIVDHPTFLLYHMATDSPWSEQHLVGPDGEKAYLENWNGGESYNSAHTTFFLTTVNAQYFTVDYGTGELYAPEAGWYLDGVELATEPTNATVYYAGGLPAYMDESGNYADVDTEGFPVNGVPKQNPPVLWSEVGFQVIDQYTIQITLLEAKTSWEVMGELLNGTTGVVHPTNFEAGLNEDQSDTTYGTQSNPLVSYGPYVLSEWNADENFMFTRNESFYDADAYRIQYIRYEVIQDLDDAAAAFDEGDLDVIDATGPYAYTYLGYENSYFYPNTTLFRFALNIDSGCRILQDLNFRKAMYFAMNREEFTQEVNLSTVPTLGFLGPQYLSTDSNLIAYRNSIAGKSVLDDYLPDAFGYDPVEAKRLFDLAYDKLVSDGVINDGDVVTIKYTYVDSNTGFSMQQWIKNMYEEIFNAGETNDIFVIELNGLTSTAYNVAVDAGDFDMIYAAWQGLALDAPSMLGQVYNSAGSYMIEQGFNTADAEITINLSASYTALQSWIQAYDSLTATPEEQALYDEWVALAAKFDVSGNLTCTYNELYGYAYNELSTNYVGKAGDFDQITAAMESVLLDQMIAIPIHTTGYFTVYRSKIVLEANEYNPWMGLGGLKYMYIANPEASE